MWGGVLLKSRRAAAARNNLAKAVCVHSDIPSQTRGDQPAARAWKYLITPISFAFWIFVSGCCLPAFDPLIMASTLKVIFLFLWLLQCGGKPMSFYSFCLLSRLFILECFQLLSFANFQRSPLGIGTLLLFLSFKHFKAERECSGKKEHGRRVR